MNRSLKSISILTTVASLVCSVGALAWRWQEAGDFAAIFEGPKPFRPLIILAMPAVLAGLLIFTEHGLARQESRLSREGRWFVSFTLLTHFTLLVAIQAWMIATYLGQIRPDPEFVTRLAAAFMGLAMAVRANFFAKQRAPTADLSGEWARTTRRSAIALVLAGLALTACAVTLSIQGLMTALGGVLVLVLFLAHAQRRVMVRL